MTTVTELEPTVLRRQKSFWGKANVLVNDAGDVALESYGTIVCWIDASTNTLHRTWDGWSRTTSVHVAEFVAQRRPSAAYENIAGDPGMSKRRWEEMPVSDAPASFVRLR